MYVAKLRTMFIIFAMYCLHLSIQTLIRILCSIMPLGLCTGYSFIKFILRAM